MIAWLLVLTAAPASLAAPEQPRPDDAPRDDAPRERRAPAGLELEGAAWHGTTWDLEVGVAVGRVHEGDEESTAVSGRLRGGVMVVREPSIWSVGPLVEVSSVEPTTLGASARFMHMWSGVWAEAGALVDIRPRPGLLGAVGWSIFGFEAQVRSDPDHGATWGLYGRILVPIRLVTLID